MLADLRARLNTVRGRSAARGRAARASRLAATPSTPRIAPAVAQIVAAFAEAVADERTDEKVAIGGTANLVRFGDEFDTSIKPLLEALEEHVVLLKLLGEATSPSTVTVRIGHEVQHEQLVAPPRRRHRLRPG